MSAYPTLEQVEHATPNDLTRWIRNLRSPADEDERVILEKIIQARSSLTDAERVRASKEVGWG